MRSAGCNVIARPVFGMTEIIPIAATLSSYLWDTTLGTIRGVAPKIQSTSSDRSSSTAERLATKAQSDAERTVENAVGHSVRRCRPGNNLKATFGNQLTAHQVCVHMQVEMPGCDIGESTVRAYIRVRKAELNEQQTSQAAAAWMMEVLHR